MRLTNVWRGAWQKLRGYAEREDPLEGSRFAGNPRARLANVLASAVVAWSAYALFTGFCEWQYYKVLRITSLQQLRRSADPEADFWGDSHNAMKLARLLSRRKLRASKEE